MHVGLLARHGAPEALTRVIQRHPLAQLRSIRHQIVSDIQHFAAWPCHQTNSTIMHGLVPPLLIRTTRPALLLNSFPWHIGDTQACGPLESAISTSVSPTTALPSDNSSRQRTADRDPRRLSPQQAIVEGCRFAGCLADDQQPQRQTADQH